MGRSAIASRVGRIVSPSTRRPGPCSGYRRTHLVQLAPPRRVSCAPDGPGRVPRDRRGRRRTRPAGRARRPRGTVAAALLRDAASGGRSPSLAVVGVFTWALIAQSRFAMRPQMPSLCFAMDAFRFLFVCTPALTGRQMAGSTRRPSSGRTCTPRWCCSRSRVRRGRCAAHRDRARRIRRAREGQASATRAGDGTRRAGGLLDTPSLPDDSPRPGIESDEQQAQR